MENNFVGFTFDYCETVTEL